MVASPFPVFSTLAISPSPAYCTGAVSSAVINPNALARIVDLEKYALLGHSHEITDIIGLADILDDHSASIELFSTLAISPSPAYCTGAVSSSMIVPSGRSPLSSSALVYPSGRCYGLGRHPDHWKDKEELKAMPNIDELEPMPGVSVNDGNDGAIPLMSGFEVLGRIPPQ